MGITGRALRRAHVRRARPRRVGRPGRDRRPAARSPTRAPSSTGSATGRTSPTTKIGAWGISYGGGAAWNSLVAGVPWAAVEIVETWTDLVLGARCRRASPSPASIGGFLPARSRRRSVDPSPCPRCATPRSPGTRRGEAVGRARARACSKLGGVTTPVFMMQGRRDFAFGIDQATRAVRAPAGPEDGSGRAPRPRAVDVPGGGHARRCSPRATRWFDRYLRGDTGCGVAAGRRHRARELGAARSRVRGTLPHGRRRNVRARSRGVTTFARSGQGRCATSAPLRRPIEVFGAPTVQASIDGERRLVAARRRAQRAHARRQGDRRRAAAASRRKPGAQTVTIQLSSQATFIPQGLAADPDARVLVTRAEPARTCSTSTCPMAAGAALASARRS